MTALTPHACKTLRHSGDFLAEFGIPFRTDGWAADNVEFRDHFPSRTRDTAAEHSAQLTALGRGALQDKV